MKFTATALALVAGFLATTAVALPQEEAAAAAAPAALWKPKPKPCTQGYMACGGTYAQGFTVCDWGNLVSFACAPGTKCYPNGNYIICNY
ncbi:hypothetical protein IWQ60_010636 [Tieghemiomyces parasiticus]|uniref:Carbohydrate-binding module family 19 domain-containing protein n=1 Tax=Tieghemiomyces parasiticus TaxID=78921 RepID=A0A9W7ZSH3_9FUNG|nr:hypothetical protein IWQ60_010636 [Tieghemiomyces parasiticus]